MEIIAEVTSVKNPLVARIQALALAREREVSGRFLAEGIKLVEEALDAGLVPLEAVASPLLATGERGRALWLRLLGLGLPCRRVSDRVLRAMTEVETHQGVLAVLERRQHEIASFEPARGPLLVAVEVQDPGNLGALLRNGEAFGAAALIAVGGADPWSPKAVRAAAGSLFRLALARCADPVELAVELARRGYRRIGAVARGGDLPGARFGGGFALFVGSEGRGLPPGLVAQLDERVTIPLQPPVESLNVAAAAAVLLFALRPAAREP